MGRGRRAIARLVVAVAVGLGALVGLAAPAFAHATLEETSPRNGEHLDAAPKEVSLHFSETVEASLGAVRVYNGDEDRLDSGRITHRGGSTVVVPLPKLGDGSYVVTWRVISADSHPVQGAFTFFVGDAKAIDPSKVGNLLGDRGGSGVVGFLYAVGRTIAFGAMLLLLGGAAFLVLVWPDGRALPHVRKAAWTAFLVLAVATVANLLLQGVYGGGLGLGHVFSTDVIKGVLDTRLGHVYELRLALLVIAAPLLTVFFNPGALGAWWPWVGGAVGVGIAATPGLAGHGAIGEWQPFALVADVAHVGAAAVWIGGLVMLVAFALPRRNDDLKAITRRYSELAFWTVTVLVGTGVFQGYRQVGSLDALTSTNYGKLLIIKSALVVVMLAVARLSRRATHARWSPDTASRVRRTVGIETAVAVGVLVVTSLLVNAVPAKTLAAAPQSGELTSATMLLDYTVSPGRRGSNEIHLYTLTKQGQPAPVVEVTLSFSLPDKDIAKIPVTLQVAGPNHFQSLAFNIPLAGRWRMDVTARTSDIDQEVFDGTVVIR